MNKRLIYADDAIEAINGMPDCPNGYSDTYDKRHIIAVLEDVPSAQPEHTETHSCDCERTGTHDWIPVTERLPEEQDEYLVTWVTKLHTGKRFVGIGIFEYDLSEDNWLFDDYMNAYIDVTVTAWMPLPEPYAERKDDE